jgi:GAF domain-containing protein
MTTPQTAVSMPMLDRWDVFLAALADTDQPRAVFAALETITKESVGTILFTAMTHDTGAMRSLRVYSGNEQAYPVGGWKPLSEGPWKTTVLDGKRPFAALTIEEIAAVFPDWPLIQSLGCESAMNLPVIVAGKVIGTLNLLDVKGHYAPARVEQAEELVPYAAVAFLTAARFQTAS